MSENPNLMSRDDIYLFNEGRHYQLYNKLGAHGGDSKKSLQRLKIWLEKAMAGSFRKAKDVQQEGIHLLNEASRELECGQNDTEDADRKSLCMELSQAKEHLQDYISDTKQI